MKGEKMAQLVIEESEESTANYIQGIVMQLASTRRLNLSVTTQDNKVIIGGDKNVVAFVKQAIVQVLTKHEEMADKFESKISNAQKSEITE
ncbi:MAG: hypothetical protein NT116_01065 [Candidatus Parcubacteria bacterium]|nr:hypothetical protein [Candidatus Parcubacteria bacterium]